MLTGLLRYPLLLKDIIKNTPEGPLRARYQDVHDKIYTIAKKINKHKRQEEFSKDLVDIQSRLQNPSGNVPCLISPSIKPIFHGEVLEYDEEASKFVCFPFLLFAQDGNL